MAASVACAFFFDAEPAGEPGKHALDACALLRQAAGARQRRLHVQRGHALLQRGVPPRADVPRRRLRQAGRPEAAALLGGDGDGVPPWAAAVQEGVHRQL
ncbi:hypothetical protein CFC21_031647, partial [Triticum aestivum]